MNFRIFAVLVLLVAFCSCTSKEKAVKSVAKLSKDDLIRQKHGIEKAEKNVTIVNINGWTKDQMDFQQRYCEGMFNNIEGYDSPAFCKCFLAKVQYYYEPIYIKDAYEDQKKWNTLCLEESQN